MNKDMTVEDWLGRDNKLGYKICDEKYKHKGETTFEMIERVCGGNKRAMQLMVERKFLLGGRTMTNRGLDLSASLSNCYSSGFVEDDYHKILDLNTKIGLTYKHQGGQGVSLSKLRPKGAPICGGEYKSDGIIPFMELFNQTTLSTSQGGSRKGALMMSLDCWHKEVEDFINLKARDGAIEAANLSVEIDDEFMSAIKDYFDSGTIVEKTITRQYGDKNTPVTYTITPIEVYRAMMRRAYDWGDPGCIFTNKFRNHNMMECCDDYVVVTGNPCGEQPLATHSACNLGSINLAEFVKHPFTRDSEFDYVGFSEAVEVAVEILDDVVSEGIQRHPLQEQREQAEKYRNIGLGFMGLADALIMMGLTYGERDAINFVDELSRMMFRVSVAKSHMLAKSRGAFPAYHKELFDSAIMKEHFTEQEQDDMRAVGLRNCSLLSIAPTGSIGTMLNISTGIEPFFEFQYQRATKSLGGETHDIEADVVKRYRAIHPTGNLPAYFITAANVSWKNRIEMQAAAQRHIDTAISSTVNLPCETTPEDMERLYLYAWQSGLKGITIFRSGCKKAGILTTSKPDSAQNPVDADNCALKRGMIIGVNDDLLSAKRTIVNGCGKFYVHVDFDESTGEALETYIDIGSGGGCERNLQFISRLISLALRSGVSIESIIDQAKSIRPCKAYIDRTQATGDTSLGTSCPSAIGFALNDLNDKIQRFYVSDEESGYEQDDSDQNIAYVPCPECGANIHFEGGCQSCVECGWSKCG